MKVKVASKSRFGRKNSVDFDFEKFQDGFEDSNTRSMIDTGVSTSTSLQSYGGAAYEEQSREHQAATRIQTAYRGFLVSICLMELIFVFLVFLIACFTYGLLIIICMLGYYRF